MKRLMDLTAETGLMVDLHLMLDMVVPVHDGFQAQGDLLVAPLAELDGRVRAADGAMWHEVPAGGVELLRGPAGGNTHSLVADPGTCVWTTDVTDADGLAIALFEAMATVYLLHREHGATGVAAGNYVVRRQRELIPPAIPELRRPPPPAQGTGAAGRWWTRRALGSAWSRTDSGLPTPDACARFTPGRRHRPGSHTARHSGRPPRPVPHGCPARGRARGRAPGCGRRR